MRYNYSMRKRSKKVSKKAQPKKKSNEVTFKAFFSKCVNTKKLKEWQEDTVWAFMKKNGLKEKEDLDTYQKMLENF